MADMDTTGAKRRRNKRWPEALKREIVAASLAPGASVSTVARRYDVNANQVFSWRRLYRQEIALPSRPSPPQLVAVTIAAEEDVRATRQQAQPAVAEAIEIEVGGDCRIRVGTGFDAHALRRVLDVVRTR